MMKYKRCLGAIRESLNYGKLKLNEEKPDKTIENELEKPITEMDTYLIGLCLNALSALRNYLSKRKNNK